MEGETAGKVWSSDLNCIAQCKMFFNSNIWYKYLDEPLSFYIDTRLNWVKIREVTIITCTQLEWKVLTCIESSNWECNSVSIRKIVT